MRYTESYSGSLIKLILIAFAVFSITFFNFFNKTEASSIGPSGPSNSVNDTSIGSYSWNTPPNVTLSDNQYASRGIRLNGPGGSTFYSHYLKATGFGYSIPAGSTINGIIVEIEKSKRQSAACPGGVAMNVADNSVKIVQNGIIGGNEKRHSGSVWANTDTYYSYGSNTDLWGLTWVADNINSANFGVAVSARFDLYCAQDGGVATVTANIDHIRITVHYTPPSYTDCGLRINENPGIVVIACEPSGALTSSLRIFKNGATYGLVLVNTSDTNASKIRIKTANQGIRALKKFSVVSCTPANQSTNMCSGYYLQICEDKSFGSMSADCTGYNRSMSSYCASKTGTYAIRGSCNFRQLMHRCTCN